MICKICNKEILNLVGLCVHLRTHNLTLLDYFIHHKNFKIPKCDICGKDRMLRKGIKFYKTCCGKSCKSKICSHAHTEETKEKLRRFRFDFMKNENFKTGWKDRYERKMSYLEQWFYDNVIMKFNLSNKFDVVNEYAEYPYFIDFAFLNIKVGVELDGRQHEYTKERDLKRDNHLSSLGWKIFRIKYNDNLEEKVKEFLLLIGQDNISEKLFDDKIYKYREIKTKIKQNKKCPDCGVDIHIQAERCIKCSSIKRRKVERPQREILIKELEKSSFVNIGKKYGVSDNTIRKWIKNEPM